MLKDAEGAQEKHAGMTNKSISAESKRKNMIENDRKRMLSPCFVVSLVNGPRVAPSKSLFASRAACGTAVPGACEEKTRHMLPQHA